MWLNISKKTNQELALHTTVNSGSLAMKLKAGSRLQTIGTEATAPSVSEWEIYGIDRLFVVEDFRLKITSIY